VVETVRSFAKLYPGYDSEVEQIIAHLEAKESFKALKIAHAMLEQQEVATKAAASVPEPVTASPVPASIEEN
jgi:hypothetical protein